MDSKIWLSIVLTLISYLNVLHAQSTATSSRIELNSILTAGTNDSWRSSSGDFEFGFFPLPGDLYLVGIWLGKIPRRPLVWSANRNFPVEANSILQLSSAGHLVLTYPNGTIAQTIDSGDSASSASMQNDGNFVLRDSNSGIVWESFDFPTDTILPGQVVSKNPKLYSKVKADSNYSTGRYRLEMQYDGRLTLTSYHYLDPSYWLTDTTTFNNVSLVFNNSGYLYLANNAQSILPFTRKVPNPFQEYYHLVTIEDCGNLKQYAYHKRNGGRLTVWKALDDPCTPTAVCGVNGMCASTVNESINCGCIPGYVPVDSHDVSKGCHPVVAVNYCAEPSKKDFKIQVIDDADIPLDDNSDFAHVTNVDFEGCKRLIMDDCYTLAASFNASTSICYKKRMPLLNARKSESTKGQKAIIKVPNNINITTTSENPTPNKKEFNVRVFLRSTLAVSATLACLFGVIAVYYHPLPRRLFRKKESLKASAIGINFRQFPFQELEEATRGFSKVIGRGASGKVYSGSLSLDESEIGIAVKSLVKGIEKSDKEFMTELRVIGQTHHRNLVRLLGYCMETNHRLLVYELMPNGALSNFLFGHGGAKPSWELRVEMALGVARGLLYLHEKCSTQIIHCDIKPQNVLVDANYTAKIADFGLSKLLKKEQTRTDTNFRGTIGYVAPEWLRSAPITAKVDVFSFGVMLLEIIFCRKHIESSEVEEGSGEEDVVLVYWVLKCVLRRELRLAAEDDREVLRDFRKFEEMVFVGLWCINPDPVLRPTMKQVTQMLEGTIQVGIPPLVYDQMSSD